MTKYYAHRLKINAQKNERSQKYKIFKTYNKCGTSNTNCFFPKELYSKAYLFPQKNIYQCSEIRSNMFTGDNQKECKHFGNNIAFFVYKL